MVDDIHQNMQVVGLLNNKHKEYETLDVFKGNEDNKKQKNKGLGAYWLVEVG